MLMTRPRWRWSIYTRTDANVYTAFDTRNGLGCCEWCCMQMLNHIWRRLSTPPTTETSDIYPYVPCILQKWQSIILIKFIHTIFSASPFHQLACFQRHRVRCSGTYRCGGMPATETSRSLSALASIAVVEYEPMQIPTYFVVDS